VGMRVIEAITITFNHSTAVDRLDLGAVSRFCVEATRWELPHAQYRLRLNVLELGEEGSGPSWQRGGGASRGPRIDGARIYQPLLTHTQSLCSGCLLARSHEPWPCFAL